MRHIEIRQMKEGELGLGGSITAGKYHIQEYENDEWVGGCYATESNLTKKIKEALEDE